MRGAWRSMKGFTWPAWLARLEDLVGAGAARAAGFWALTLLWLPAIESAEFLTSVAPSMGHVHPPVGYLQILTRSLIALLVLAPMGLPSALLCQELRRLEYRRTACVAGAAVLAAAVAIIHARGGLTDALSGPICSLADALNMLTMVLPVWIVVYPATVGLMVWMASTALQRRGEASARLKRADSARRTGFWLLALLWLPALVIGAILIEISPLLGTSPSAEGPQVSLLPLAVAPMGEVQLWVRFLPMFAIALFVFSPAGLAVALPCRELRRLGYRRAAWTVGTAAALTTAALLWVAMELFLLATAPAFTGTIGRIVETLYYTAQMLPADIPVYLAVLNLPLLAVVLLSGQRHRTRGGGTGPDSIPDRTSP